MKNAKKSPFIRVLCAVLSAVTLVTSLQTAALAAEQMIEPELSSYLIEFADSDSAAEFESNADIQTLSVNETLVAAELTENHAQALSESDEVVTLEADIIVKANEGEESQEETTLEETTPEEYEEENTEEGTQEETEEATESVTWSTKALCAQNLSETGEGVKVAVLDSGLDFYSEVAPAGIVDFVDPEFARGDDMTGHGTAVSGIIAAPEDESGIIGIAPDAELYSVRVLDESNEAPISRIISGIDWCIENEVDIINMSFGTSEYSALLEEKIEEAAQAGILLIASAGNGESVQYPAKFTEVIAVGSVTSAMIKAEDSATGGELEFVAPGENVYSTSLLGGYGAFSGTSLASPHIAGAAAVLLGKDTTKSPEFIRALLAASCKTLGEAESYGNGIPDLAFALQIYDDFAQNYTDPSYQPPQNTGNPENFTQEDVYVVGEWSTAAHNTLADEFFDETSYSARFPKFVKAISYSCDQYFGTVLALHGNGNYIVFAKLLYEIAVNYKTDSSFNHKNYGAQIAASVNETDKYDDLLETVSKMIEMFTVGSDKNKLNSTGLSTDIITAEGKQYAPKLIDEYFYNLTQKKSTIVIGVFFHLIGDIYAHRSIVPTTAIDVENRIEKGNSADIANANDGIYYVKSDFNSSCGRHLISLDKEIEQKFNEILKEKRDAIKNNYSYYKIIAFVEYIIFYVFGRNDIEKEYETKRKGLQREIDLKLLENAKSIPTKAKGKKICTETVSCYDALKRITGLGVLQFKDIKYFLKDIDIYLETNKMTKRLKENWNYYEDNAPSNVFYNRRYLVSKNVCMQYLSDYFSNVIGEEGQNFYPYYLLSEVYGTNISKYCVKIDQFYNYLKAFHSGSEVLQQSFWESKTKSLFHYTTIIYKNSYFIDPNTYSSNYGKPKYYSNRFPYNDISAEDFYYGGKAW